MVDHCHEGLGGAEGCVSRWEGVKVREWVVGVESIVVVYGCCQVSEVGLDAC